MLGDLHATTDLEYSEDVDGLVGVGWLNTRIFAMSRKFFDDAKLGTDAGRLAFMLQRNLSPKVWHVVAFTQTSGGWVMSLERAQP